MKLGLLGNDISYSLSPLIFRTLSRQLNMDIDYELIDVKKDDIRLVIDKLKSGELLGFNVTKPYKEEIIQYCDELVGDAKHIGSVNTVMYRNQKVIGYNTDVFGFKKLFEESQFESIRPVYIFGNGGAAKSVAQCLHSLDIPVTIVKRRISSRKQIKDHEIYYDEVPQGSGLIIQSTTVGLHENDALLVDKDILMDKSLIDLIYHLNQTLHMEHAKQSFNGLTMLLYQGIKSFSIWTNDTINMNQSIIDQLKEVLKHELYR
ncbi:MAG: shikimate dehydrogenase family protein [Acholeplasmataceae bacterium]